MARTLLITGATGKQGGAVINALLRAKSDFNILAVTRNAQSPSAQKLAQKSNKIKLVTGDTEKADDLFKNAKDAINDSIFGVFSVQSTFDQEQEKRQGKGLVDAAIANGVKHFVYSSVDRGGPRSDNDPTNVPHFASKYNIEKYLSEAAQNTDMAWTILRPVAFMDNLTPEFFGKVFTASYEISLRKSQKLQLIATSDIGFFAAEVFAKPEQYKNKGLSLAGDELTYGEFKKVFEQKTGKTLPTTFHFIARFIQWMVKDMGYMFKWFHDVGYGADLESLKKINPGIKDFGAWLETESTWKSR